MRVLEPQTPAYATAVQTEKLSYCLIAVARTSNRLTCRATFSSVTLQVLPIHIACRLAKNSQICIFKCETHLLHNLLYCIKLQTVSL